MERGGHGSREIQFESGELRGHSWIPLRMQSLNPCPAFIHTGPIVCKRRICVGPREASILPSFFIYFKYLFCFFLLLLIFPLHPPHNFICSPTSWMFFHSFFPPLHFSLTSYFTAACLPARWLSAQLCLVCWRPVLRFWCNVRGLQHFPLFILRVPALCLEHPYDLHVVCFFH